MPRQTSAALIPTQAPPAFAFAGRTITVACDRKVLDLRVTESTGDDSCFFASAPRLLVREGLIVGIRVFEDGAVWRLAYQITRAEPISPAEAEVQLQLLESELIGEERQAVRADYKSLATLRSVYFAAYEMGAFRVHTHAISRLAVAFECERRFDLGTKFDFALDDETGHTILARVEVVRTEPGLFGRLRVVARFIAIDEVDRVLPDRLIARTVLRDEVGLGQAPPPTLRDQRLPERRRGLARLLRRS